MTKGHVYRDTWHGGARCYCCNLTDAGIAERHAQPAGWRPGMRYTYRTWSPIERQDESRARVAEWRRFKRMTDSELRAQVRSLVDTSEYIYQDLARIRCALDEANRRGVECWPRLVA